MSAGCAQAVGVVVLVAGIGAPALAADGGAPAVADPCEGKKVADCRARAESLRETGTPEAKAQARALFLHTCAAGDALSCASAAWLEPDAARRFALYLKSCDGGYGGGCDEIAELFERGDSYVRPNPGLARGYYERGCSLGDGDSCESASTFYENRAPEFPVDKKRARALYRRAIELGWEPPHERERHATRWKGRLYCADLTMRGMIFVKGACAGSAALCEDVAKNLSAADTHIEGHTPCKPASGNVWCGRRGRDLVCSNQEFNCAMVLEIAAGLGVATSEGCTAYVKGESEFFPTRRRVNAR